MWADWSFPHGAWGEKEGGGRGQAHTKLVVSVIWNQNKEGAAVNDFPNAGVPFWALCWNYREATSQLVVCFF